MRFLADMGISPRTVEFLRVLGHDAIHLHEEKLDQLPDRGVLAKALNEGRVILTHDLDFGELMAASGGKLPSVIIFRLRNMRPERVNAYLEQAIVQHETALERGAIIAVTERQIRVRLLPLSA
jgi:predicted nuclease of predicted toxin-antitoxin system